MKSERKTTSLIGGKMIAVTDVPFVISPDAPEVAFEYVLPDGSLLRARFVATAIFRADGQTDDNGHPVYYVRNTLSTVLIGNTLAPSQGPTAVPDPQPAAKSVKPN